MTDVMQRCVPLSTGALGPDLRVNYQFGLVLGVDEFEQEDLYFRERDERHARSLHGYGTDVGLDVTAGRPAAGADEVEIRVSPGIAVDQHGRPIVVRAAQCGMVGAWIAEEERLAAEENRPSPLAAHRTPSGDVTIYVVAGYSSCLDALVPMPGNPCGSDDEITAPSRVRDSWAIEFRWEPPKMEAWDGVRALADLLLRIDLEDSSPLEDDEVLLAKHIRALKPGAAPPLDPLPAVPRLPRHGARAAFDRLLTIWITEVRPTLRPDLITPDDEAAILLAAVTVVPAAPFDPANPVLVDFDGPDNEGRPYLAPTQLIQELVLMGSGATTILGGGSPLPPQAVRPQIQLATLGEGVGARRVRHLVLWPNLADPLVLPRVVGVRRNGAAPVDFNTEANADGSWILTPAGRPALADREFLAVELLLDDIDVEVGGGRATVALPRYLDDAGLEVVGRVADRVVLHHQMSVTPADPPTPPDPIPPRDIRDVVTITAINNDNRLQLELWFHVDEAPDVDERRVEKLHPDNVQVLAEFEAPGVGDQREPPVPLSFEVVPIRHNVIRLDVFDDWERVFFSRWLRVVLISGAIEIDGFGGTLRDYYESINGMAPSWFDGGERLVTYVRTPEPFQ